MTSTLVVDTNVVYAAVRSRLGASYELIRRVNEGKIRIGITTSLLLEYEEVLLRSSEDLQVSPQFIREVLDEFCRIGVLAEVRFRVRPAAMDPADDMVL